MQMANEARTTEFSYSMSPAAVGGTSRPWSRSSEDSKRSCEIFRSTAQPIAAARSQMRRWSSLNVTLSIRCPRFHEGLYKGFYKECFQCTRGSPPRGGERRPLSSTLGLCGVASSLFEPFEQGASYFDGLARRVRHRKTSASRYSEETDILRKQYIGDER